MTRAKHTANMVVLLRQTLMVITLVASLVVRQTLGHGRLMDPPARNSMWRLGFNTPVNYNDNELYCGGRMVQWVRNGGKCGVCGDPWHGPRDHEAGGQFAKGIITRTYKQGDKIPITVHLTANHQGFFEIRVCPVNNVKATVTQECLDQHVLEVGDGGGVGAQYPVPKGKYNAFFNYTVQLPPSLTCTQCVLQWKYHTANTWDKDDNSETFCLGCGPQEEFYNCADIEIQPDKAVKSKLDSKSDTALKADPKSVKESKSDSVKEKMDKDTKTDEAGKGDDVRMSAKEEKRQEKVATGHVLAPSAMASAESGKGTAASDVVKATSDRDLVKDTGDRDANSERDLVKDTSDHDLAKSASDRDLIKGNVKGEPKPRVDTYRWHAGSPLRWVVTDKSKSSDKTTENTEKDTLANSLDKASPIDWTKPTDLKRKDSSDGTKSSDKDKGKSQDQSQSLSIFRSHSLHSESDRQSSAKTTASAAASEPKSLSPYAATRHSLQRKYLSPFHKQQQSSLYKNPYTPRTHSTSLKTSHQTHSPSHQTSRPTSRPSSRLTSQQMSHSTSQKTSHSTSRPSSQQTSHQTHSPSHQSHSTSQQTSHPTPRPSSHQTSHPTSHPTSHQTHSTSQHTSHPTPRPSSQQPHPYYTHQSNPSSSYQTHPSSPFQSSSHQTHKPHLPSWVVMTAAKKQTPSPPPTTRSTISTQHGTRTPTGETPAKTTSEEAEQNAKKKPKSASPFEATQSAKSKGASPVEAAQSSKSKGASPYDASQSAKSKSASPFEATQSVQSKGAIPVEAAQSSKSKGASFVEAVQSSKSKSASPFEAVQSVQYKGASPVEAAQSVQSKSTSPFEAVQSAKSKSASPFEAIQSIQSKGSSPFEAVQSVQSKGASPFEASPSAKKKSKGTSANNDGVQVAKKKAKASEGSSSTYKSSSPFWIKHSRSDEQTRQIRFQQLWRHLHSAGHKLQSGLDNNPDTTTTTTTTTRAPPQKRSTTTNRSTPTTTTSQPDVTPNSQRQQVRRSRLLRNLHLLRHGTLGRRPEGRGRESGDTGRDRNDRSGVPSWTSSSMGHRQGSNMVNTQGSLVNRQGSPQNQASSLVNTQGSLMSGSPWWRHYNEAMLSPFSSRLLGVHSVGRGLQCRATVSLGGGMDEWCTANCNANYCPAPMCVCHPVMDSAASPSYRFLPTGSPHAAITPYKHSSFGASTPHHYPPSTSYKRSNLYRRIAVSPILQRPVSHFRHQHSTEAVPFRGRVSPFAHLRPASSQPYKASTGQGMTSSRGSIYSNGQETVKSHSSGYNRGDSDSQWTDHSDEASQDRGQYNANGQNHRNNQNGHANTKAKSIDHNNQWSEHSNANIASKSVDHTRSGHSSANSATKSADNQWTAQGNTVDKEPHHDWTGQHNNVKSDQWTDKTNEKSDQWTGQHNEVKSDHNNKENRYDWNSPQNTDHNNNAGMVCVATGLYAGLPDYDVWCSNNCAQAMCPLLMCTCRHVF